MVSLCWFSSWCSRLRSSVMSMLRLVVRWGIILSFVCLTILPSSCAAVRLSCGLGDSSSCLSSVWRLVSSSVSSALISCWVWVCCSVAYSWVLPILSVLAISLKVYPCVSRSTICLARTWFFSSMPVRGVSVMVFSMYYLWWLRVIRVNRTEQLDGFLTLHIYCIIDVVLRPVFSGSQSIHGFSVF